ncbi:MAG: GDSL-type esterase/lipase family protein [Victivallaceae bacterium]|nr:GDSL-type esterase/lipase family protein [Victivallaceae bacterium]
MSSASHAPDSAGASPRRIALIGDSVTHDGEYPWLLQLYASCRDPRSRVEILNRGISGGNAVEGFARLEEDVLAQGKLDAAVVCFGLNDVDRDAFAPTVDSTGAKQARLLAARERYWIHMEKISAALESHGIRVYALTPPPYDEWGSQQMPPLAGCDTLGVSLLADGLKHSFSQKGRPVIDLHQVLVELYRKRLSPPIAPDRVHPDRRGQLVIASLLAEALFPEKAAASTWHFPLEDSAAKAIQKELPLLGLVNSGTVIPERFSDVLGALAALKRATLSLRLLRQVDDMIARAGGDPGNGSQTDVRNCTAELLKSPQLSGYREYFSAVFRNYLAVRTRRKELQIAWGEASERYFATVTEVAARG